MKNKLLTSVALIILILSACTPRPKNPGTGINFFAGNFDEAKVEAGNQNKLIFLYAHTDWCGYCTKMSKSTFKEKEVDDYMNAHYINLSYDMEKGEGIQIGKKYGISSYPAYLILDVTGEVLSKGLGYLPTEKFMQFVKRP